MEGVGGVVKEGIDEDIAKQQGAVAHANGVVVGIRSPPCTE